MNNIQKKVKITLLTILILSFPFISFNIVKAELFINPQVEPQTINNNLPFWIIFIFFICINMLFLFYRRKTIEIIGLHSIIMLVCLFLGIYYLMPIEPTISILFMLITTVAFVADVLMVEI